MSIALAARLAALERRRARTDNPTTWTDRTLLEAVAPAFEQLTDEQRDLLADACEADARRHPLTAEQIAALQACEMAALPLVVALRTEVGT